MPTIYETINSAYAIYKLSLKGEELLRAAQTLSGLLSDTRTVKIMSVENRENAQYLSVKLTLKKYAVAYFCEGYENADFIELKKYVEEIVPSCRALNFVKTVDLCERVLACADAVDRIAFDAVALKARICDGEGRCVAKDTEECRAVSEAVNKKIVAAQGLELPINIFENGVKFPDVKAQFIDDLTELYKLCERTALSFSSAQAEGILRTALKDITQKLNSLRLEYYPKIDMERLARAIVLFTPFEEEAEILAWACADGGKIFSLQALAFEGLDESSTKAVFEELTRRGGDLVIYGMPHFREKNKNEFYRAVMRFAKAGRRAYIVADDGSRGVYDEAVKAACGDVSELDISFFYLSVPDFTQTVETMQELNMLAGGEDIDFVRKNLPFMGFAGFNEAVKAFKSLADWKKIAVERSQDNAPAATKYMLKMPRQALFIDGGWGNYHEDIIVKKSKKFDYDDIKLVNPDNIKKIMEGNFSLFQKCGMISTYCLLCGASASDWANFSPEVKGERLTEASKLVMRALGLSTVPKVEVLEELDVSGAGGLCCDGGKRIVYKNGCVKDFDWTAKAVCHECYHAFQHHAMAEGWQDWYETELHVTPGRIDQWSYNYGKYRNINKDRDGYMIQLVESDARAFENDCLGKNESMGQILNLIDLD
ncbi:MAG: hypothetical protein K2K39_02010 [Clostridia bacterium]|nr:hypothetical protein [Clostridia bacterium]